MDVTNLDRGNKILREIKEYKSSLDFFNRLDINGKSLDIKLCEFFTECRNIPYPGGKNDLAKTLISFTINSINDSIDKLENEFEEL